MFFLQSADKIESISKYHTVNVAFWPQAVYILLLKTSDLRLELKGQHAFQKITDWSEGLYVSNGLGMPRDPSRGAGGNDHI